MRVFWLAIGAAGLAGCVIDYGVGSAPGQPLVSSTEPADKPIDILFVVDNSGSMAEEQAALARTIYKPECPITDLEHVPEALLDPAPGVLEELSTVCGFSQILAAYDRDFRVGVITTDVDACDNALSEATDNDAWGYRPQRGCLQPVPSTGQKIIARDDVDVAGKFRELLDNVGTFGSPFERGLDAADVFLGGDSWVADGCEGDRDLFLRDEAQLMVVFVTDEDDCSHDGSDFPDETLTTCGPGESIVTEHRPDDCYDDAAALTPVRRYAERLAAVKGPNRADDVSVVVIAGAIPAGGGFIAAGCDKGAALLPGQCRPSHGLSNFTGPGEPCDATLDTPCCTADAGSRYFELQDDVALTGGSICSESFVDTLIAATQKTEG